LEYKKDTIDILYKYGHKVFNKELTVNKASLIVEEKTNKDIIKGTAFNKLRAIKGMLGGERFTNPYCKFKKYNKC
jgi:hypothetical protein